MTAGTRLRPAGLPCVMTRRLAYVIVRCDVRTGRLHPIVSGGLVQAWFPEGGGYGYCEENGGGVGNWGWGWTKGRGWGVGLM